MIYLWLSDLNILFYKISNSLVQKRERNFVEKCLMFKDISVLGLETEFTCLSTLNLTLKPRTLTNNIMFWTEGIYNCLISVTSETLDNHLVKRDSLQNTHRRTSMATFFPFLASHLTRDRNIPFRFGACTLKICQSPSDYPQPRLVQRGRGRRSSSQDEELCRVTCDTELCSAI